MSEAPLPTLTRINAPRPDALSHEPSRPREIPVIPGLAPKENLPVWQNPYHSDLTAAIKDPNVSTIILAAGTGTGKTRGGSQIALEALGPEGRMIVTENLRRATVESAKVVAADMKVPLGEDVGVRNRDTHDFTDKTRLLFCPVQSLLVIMEDDPLLERYNLVAMDEVHKESKANELCMIRLRDIQKERQAKGKPPLKLVFISATADKEKIGGYFPGSKTIEVPPVETFSVDEVYEKNKEIAMSEVPAAAAQKVRDSITAGDKGNILVFLSGEAEIKKTAAELRDLQGVKVIPYYSAASKEEQDSLFADSSQRKIVLATNAAQEGLTLDINIVVDSGMYKRTELDLATGREYLVEHKAPQDHLIQRRGRVGRKKSPFPGQNDKYYALFSHDDFISRPKHETADMQRTDLSQEVLILMAQGNKDVYGFPYINKPPKAHLDAAIRRLTAIGAVENGQLTKRGKLMAELQIKPNLAAVVVSGAEHGAIHETAALAAMLEAYDKALDTRNGAPATFRDPNSDILGYVKLFTAYRSLPDAGARKKWARDNGLNYWKLNDALHLYNELIYTVKSKRPDLNLDRAPSANAFDRSIMEGFADNLIHRQFESTYEMDTTKMSLKLSRDSVYNTHKPHHLASINIRPLTQEGAITERVAELNHAIPDELIQSLPGQEAVKKDLTAANGPAAETLSATAPQPILTPVQEPPESETPPRHPTFGQRVRNWISHSFIGTVWKWLTG